METKVCRKCGIEKPIEEFVKNSKIKSGYSSHCKECHRLYGASPKQIKDAPDVEASVVEECKKLGLDKVPGRLLVKELRRRGYRGELELVTVQKIVI